MVVLGLVIVAAGYMLSLIESVKDISLATIYVGWVFVFGAGVGSLLHYGLAWK